jgi:CMP-N,N'-diacetyllegionaminic acid synthase
MKLVAIIPARKGSKRIPEKNTKPIMGKNFVQWTIERALQVKAIEKVVVTTDDPDLLNLQPKYQGVLFLKRPDDLCTDAAPTSDALLHAIQNVHSDFTHFVLLQPTSPLRTASHISQAIDLFVESRSCQLVSVKETGINPNHVLEVIPGALSFLTASKSEYFKNLMVLNGAIYISEIPLYQTTKSFVTPETKLFSMDELSSIDVDLESDWQKALFFAQQVKQLF